MDQRPSIFRSATGSPGRRTLKFRPLRAEESWDDEDAELLTIKRPVSPFAPRATSSPFTTSPEFNTALPQDYNAKSSVSSAVPTSTTPAPTPFRFIPSSKVLNEPFERVERNNDRRVDPVNQVANESSNNQSNENRRRRASTTLTEADVTAAALIKKLQTEVDKLKERNRNLEKLASQYGSAALEGKLAADTLENKRPPHEGDEARLRGQLEDRVAECARLRAERERARSDLAEVEARAKKTKSILAARDAEASALSSEVHRLRQELMEVTNTASQENLRAEAAKSRSALVEANERISLLEQKLREAEEAFEKNLKEVSRVKDKLEIRLQGLEAEIGKKENEIRELEEELNKAESKLGKADAEIVKLKGEVKRRDHDLNELKKGDPAKKKLDGEVKKLESELKKSQELIRKLEKTAGDDSGDLEKERQALLAQDLKLKAQAAQLDEEAKEIRQAEAELAAIKASLDKRVALEKKGRKRKRPNLGAELACEVEFLNEGYSSKTSSVELEERISSQAKLIETLKNQLMASQEMIAGSSPTVNNPPETKRRRRGGTSSQQSRSSPSPELSDGGPFKRALRSTKKKL